MPIRPDTSSWISCGQTSNSRYYEVETGILVCLPDERSSDTEATAHENTRFQEQYWIERQRTGTCMVFFDFLVDQTPQARRIYAKYPYHYQRGTALVGGTALSRALASFFMGLSLPSTPTKMFGSYEEAATWCRRILTQEGARLP